MIQLSKSGENATSEDESQEESSEEEICDENEDGQHTGYESTEKCLPEKDLEILRKQVDMSTAEAMSRSHSSKIQENQNIDTVNIIISEDLSVLHIKDEKLNEIDIPDQNKDADINNVKRSSTDKCEESDSVASIRGPSSRYAPSSVASTIAPEVIKARVKASLEKRKRNHQMKRIRTKGDTSAVTKQRSENKNEIKTSTDAFWAD